MSHIIVSSRPFPNAISKLEINTNPDYVFFPHWSHKIPPEIYNTHKCIIFHMTDLPYGRGGSPLQNLIIRGHTETVISAIACCDVIDGGDVYMKSKPFPLTGSAREIFNRVDDIITGMIETIVRDNPTPTPQTGDVVTFTRRTPDQSEIKDVDNLYDLIRMLDAAGYPPAFLDHDNHRYEFTNAQLNNGEIKCQVTIKPSS